MEVKECNCQEIDCEECEAIRIDEMMEDFRKEYKKNKINEVEDDESICSSCKTPLNNCESYKNSGMCYPCYVY